MKKVLLDTNALMAMAEFKVDLFGELEKIADFPFKAYVLSGTIAELESIRQRQPGKYKRAASLALALLRAKNVPVIREAGNVDELLVKHSQRGALVLTQDQALKKRLQKPYLTIRQKRKVILVG